MDHIAQYVVIQRWYNIWMKWYKIKKNSTPRDECCKLTVVFKTLKKTKYHSKAVFSVCYRRYAVMHTHVWVGCVCKEHFTSKMSSTWLTLIWNTHWRLLSGRISASSVNSQCHFSILKNTIIKKFPVVHFRLETYNRAILGALKPKVAIAKPNGSANVCQYFFSIVEMLYAIYGQKEEFVCYKQYNSYVFVYKAMYTFIAIRMHPLF